MRSEQRNNAKVTLRILDAHEIGLVAGAGDEEPGDIVVTGKRMTDNQIAAYDSWHDQASWFVNLGIIAGVGAAGYFGWAGWAGAGAAVGNELLSDNKEALIDQITEDWYRADESDGCVDGAYVPGGWTPPGGMAQYCEP